MYLFRKMIVLVALYLTIPSLYSYPKIKVDFDVALLKIDGETQETTLQVKRIDLDLSMSKKKLSSKFRFNMIGRLNDPPSLGNSVLASIEDAWVKYTLVPQFALKMGFEDSYWVYPGNNTHFWNGFRLAPEERYPKIEFSGQITRTLQYKVMFWEDILPGGSAEEDPDGVIGTNIALMGTFKLGKLAGGIIYKIDRAPPESESVSESDKSGYSAFASYSLFRTNIYGKLTQLKVDQDSDGGGVSVLGLAYPVVNRLTALASIVIAKPISIGDTEAQEQVTMDFAGKYRHSNEISHFIQFIMVGKTDDNPAESTLAVGVEGRL